MSKQAQASPAARALPFSARARRPATFLFVTFPHVSHSFLPSFSPSPDRSQPSPLLSFFFFIPNLLAFPRPNPVTWRNPREHGRIPNGTALPQNEQCRLTSPGKRSEAVNCRCGGKAPSFPSECIWPASHQDTWGPSSALTVLPPPVHSRPLHPRPRPAWLLQPFGPLTPPCTFKGLFFFFFPLVVALEMLSPEIVLEMQCSCFPTH